VRFVISANIGSAIFYFLNEAMVIVLSSLLPYQPITAAWLISYLISIFLQYILHAMLVFGWSASFWGGMLSTYAGYSGALVASIPINIALVNTAGLSASHAWLGTLIITGIANFFVLSVMLGKSNDPGVLKRSQSKVENNSLAEA